MDKLITVLRKLTIFGVILIGCMTQDNFIAKIAVGILFGIIATIVCGVMEGILGYEQEIRKENNNTEENQEDER